MCAWIVAAMVSTLAADDDQALVREASDAMRRATKFFTGEVSTEGGYLYAYSADLVRREGERKASATTVWVQPPGTPAVGMAFLKAYEATGDAFYLQAARRAADALVKGQLRSGGWDYEIQFDAASRRKTAYRVEPNDPQGRNVTVLDDNTSQAALRLLMRVDQALEFKDTAIHEAVQYALEHVLAAQYPNGAWPQRFDKPVDGSQFPIVKARYPETWSRTFPKINYNAFYTFNDNAIDDVIEVMLEAGEIYSESKYRAAALRGGDFILLAQMPDPQPAWAQQYDAEMQPVWARKFEPPAITGSESQSILDMLLYLHQETGEAKYLEPIPRAIAYLRTGLLPDGQLARFYELKTNRPLYFTRDYQLTYSDADVPTHYSFKIESKLDRIEDDYKKRLAGRQIRAKSISRKPPSKDTIQKARRAIAGLDDRGRWVEAGKLKFDPAGDSGEPVILSHTFIVHMNALSNYVAAAKASK
jgi:PelA/Pel-15E family pectate lyase